MARFTKAAQEKRLMRAAREMRNDAVGFLAASLATRDRATAGHLHATALVNAVDAVECVKAARALYHRNYIGPGY